MKYTLSQARILANLKQVEMAEKLSMSEKTYIQYEKYRRVMRMDQAANFLKVVPVSCEEIIFF